MLQFKTETEYNNCKLYDEKETAKGKLIDSWKTS